MTIFGACAYYRRHVRGAVMNLSRATTTCPAPLFSSRPRCWHPHVCQCYFATVRLLSSLILPVSLAADDLGICTCCRGTHVPSIVSKLLRAGDVVWDIALGDEGNVGKMVWDGGYLVVCTLSHPGNFSEAARFRHDAHRTSTTSTRASASHLLTSTIWRSCRCILMV